MTQETQTTQKDLGNTITKSKTIRNRKWCFTLNNYSIEEHKDMIKQFNTTTQYYIVGEEVGEKGTAHLQGYIEYKNARTLSSMKKINNRCHWEKARGNREANFIYCSKDNKFETNDEHHIMLKKYKDIVWKTWQKNILDILNTPADDRKITWIIDKKGNSGKSFLCKYIYLTNKDNTIVTSGKATDSFNQILNHMKENNKVKICIIDVPRCMKEYISYQGIEKIKDGLFHSSKYEGGICCFPPPHIIVFANSKPDYTKFTSDRWNIININEDDNETDEE